MDRATFESQKAFAGEKKASMQRRCVDNDYMARRMYMITMVTEGRKPLFGQVVGHSEAVEPSLEVPHIALSPLGEVIEQIWQTIGNHHPKVKVVALQMMPDHLHAILFVKERMEKPLGKVLLGVKQACNKAFREVMPEEFVAVAQQHAEQSRANGLLFAKGFNDQILLREGQLQRWLNYLKDNPRRLLMKRGGGIGVASYLKRREGHPEGGIRGRAAADLSTGEWFYGFGKARRHEDGCLRQRTAADSGSLGAS